MQLHMQADGMKPKYLVVLMVIILASNCFIVTNIVKNTKADVLPKYYVDNDYNINTPGWLTTHFNKIQEAIDNSSSGDRIIVYSGTYSEAVFINHSLDLFGEDEILSTITGDDTGDRLTINAAYVNISHFTIQNCGTGSFNAVINVHYSNTIITDNKIKSGGKHGVYINHSENNIIYDNEINTNSGTGVLLNHSNNNNITYNYITSNSNNGLFLHNSSNNTIQNNYEIVSNDHNGIFLNETCDYNIISNNNISGNTYNGIFLNNYCNFTTISNNNDIYDNGYSGIRLENSSNSTVTSNTINKNDDYGIILVGSNTLIQSNIIYNCVDHGIYLFADNSNNITGNTIRTNSKDGIRMSNSTNDSINSNIIYGNTDNGIYLDYFTIQNLVYNNHFYDNTNNSVDKSINSISGNRWNETPYYLSGGNIVGGDWIYGNYYDDFDESSEGATNSSGGHIADEDHTIYGSNIDYGPLLDAIPPTLGAPSATPNTQAQGGNTYISCSVTDDIEIKDVRLIISYPNSYETNFSILSNNSGSTYYCDQAYSMIGKYTYRIAAKDPKNWRNTTNYYFYVDEGSAPTITDNSDSTAAPSTIFKVNATIADDVSLSVFKVDWYQYGNSFSGNYSMTNEYGNYYVFSINLDSSLNDLTYTIYAEDNAGRYYYTSETTVTIIDSIAPVIVIEKYGSSEDILPNSYTYGVTVTDDNEVDEVSIEYWYDDNDHVTVAMDQETTTYYEKTIVINENPSNVYCIIYASDPTGNINNTKNPIANSTGPYAGVIGISVTFYGSNSYDLDGNISTYSWDFGDGTTLDGEIVEHIYFSTGTYTYTLTATDDDGNTDTHSSYATIYTLTKVTTTDSKIEYINSEYNLSLTDLFYCYDSTGDLISDKFVDPNDVLKPVHTEAITIDGKITFLLSIDDEYNPEFMWDSTNNNIYNISHQQVTISKDDAIEDEETKTATVNITVEKDDWIWIDVNDLYPDSSVNITTNSGEISSELIWRKNSRIYVLDDPDTEYSIIFNDIYQDVTTPTFYPNTGGTINEYNYEIMIVFNIEVSISSATFNNKNVKSDLITDDDKIFYYSPPGYWDEDIYDFEITATSKKGTSEISSLASYYYVPWESPPTPAEKSFFEQYFILILFGIVGAAGAIVYLLSRLKLINFESFIYIKNKKIIPFFKPIIFGPLRIDVNDKKVKKAEFYINGKLEDTITQEPFIWNWNEPSIRGKTIETKVFDEEGNVSTSGEMKFYIFNTPKFFK